MYIFHWFSYSSKGLESPGLKSREGKRHFSILQNAETGCDVLPTSFPIGSVFLSRGQIWRALILPLNSI